jgi:predicted RNA-binding Zn-ribbon protein involved in translation (DUF1610 family)
VKIKLKFLTVILSIFLFQIGGFSTAEPKIPYVYKYSLSTRNKDTVNSVIFNHAKHGMEYKITCVDCHHQLEAGAEAVKESCLDCHGSKAIRRTQHTRLDSGEKRVQPYLIVLHEMCVDCHKEIKANHLYSKVPVACWRCHVRKKK